MSTEDKMTIDERRKYLGRVKKRDHFHNVKLPADKVLHCEFAPKSL